MSNRGQRRLRTGFLRTHAGVGALSRTPLLLGALLLLGGYVAGGILGPFVGIGHPLPQTAVRRVITERDEAYRGWRELPPRTADVGAIVSESLWSKRREWLWPGERLNLDWYAPQYFEELDCEVPSSAAVALLVTGVGDVARLQLIRIDPLTGRVWYHAVAEDDIA